MTNGQKITDKLAEIHGNEDFTIAFLPYKRSMWSSMKSVYESCKNAHIYPLPYYLINHKGLVERSAKDNFDNAEDIKTLKKADFLVIHYPYDSHNAVTQMLPQYYIRNLKRFGKVIYIPYAQVGIDFLWNQPGLGYVDYVFLNTEEDSERFKALWKSKGVDFEGRVFGLGSPKLDIKAEGETILDSVIVASSLMAFLLNPTERIQRWKENINAELSKGKTVTFRPHPLLFQTIKAMRFDMMQKYMNFIDSIKADGVKVDLSEDLEKALSVHEYLISDPSSIVGMWEALGKPYKII